MKITINDVQIQNLKRGFILNDRLDEELDTGLIEFINTNENEYIPFSVVKVFITSDETPDHTYFVDADQVVLLNKDTPKYYQHTISLIELTKVLERYPVESIAFSQPREETGLTRYTLSSVLTRLNAIIPLETNARLSSTRKLTFDSSFTTELNTIKSPQFFFNNLNLFQVLSEVLKYIDSIPRITTIENGFYKLDRDNFNEIKEIISYANHNNLAKSINSEYYSNKLEMNVENGISDTLETYPSSKNYAPLTTENFVLTTNDFKLILPKPIYEIKSLKMLAAYDATDLGANSRFKFKYVDIDLTNRTFETDFYNALKVNDPSEISKYGSLVYKKGENKIEGFGVAFPQLWGLFSTTTLDQVFDTNDDVVGIFLPYYGGNGTINVEGNNIGSATLKGFVGFKVEYYPYITQRVAIQKQSPTEINDYSLISNQGGRSIDISRLLTNGQATLNRLGNKDLMVEKLVLDYDDRFKVGQYTTDNWIVTSVENAIDTIIKSKAVFTKNFNRLSSFVGVDREIRQFNIPLEETVNRNLKYEEYLIVDNQLNTGTTSGWSATGRTLLKNMFVNTNVNDTINGIIVETKDTDTSRIGKFMLSVSKSHYKNGNIFHFNFENNQVAYYYPIIDTSGLFSELVSQKEIVRYTYFNESDVTDIKNGTLEYLSIDLINSDVFKTVQDLCRQKTNYAAAEVEWFNNPIFAQTYPNGVYYYLTTPYTDSFGFTSNYVLFFKTSGGGFDAYSQTESDVFFDIFNNRSIAGIPRTSHPAYLKDTYSLTTEEATKYAYNSQSVVDDYLRSTHSLMNLTDLVVKKDPAETISMTYQLQFTSKKPHIILGFAFAKYNSLMVNRSLLDLDQRRIHLYRSTQLYRDGEVKAKGSKILTSFTGFSVQDITDGFSVTLTFSTSSFNSWALGDNDGNLYFAVNKKPDGVFDTVVNFQFKNKL